MHACRKMRMVFTEQARTFWNLECELLRVCGAMNANAWQPSLSHHRNRYTVPAVLRLSPDLLEKCFTDRGSAGVMMVCMKTEMLPSWLIIAAALLHHPSAYLYSRIRSGLKARSALEVAHCISSDRLLKEQCILQGFKPAIVHITVEGLATEPATGLPDTRTP